MFDSSIVIECMYMVANIVYVSIYGVCLLCLEFVSIMVLGNNSLMDSILSYSYTLQIG